MEGETLELPSTGILGYSPPDLTDHPKSVKFGFEGIESEWASVFWEVKADADIGVLVNDRYLGSVAPAEDWSLWCTVLFAKNLNSSRNVLEFRNLANQSRSSSFLPWQLRRVELLESGNSKPVAGARLLGASPRSLETRLGDPYPAPFNAEVTVPFTTTGPGPVRLSIYNLAGQRIRLLRDEWTAAGPHQARWDGRTDSGTDTGSGVYLVFLQAPGLTQSARLVLIR